MQADDQLKDLRGWIGKVETAADILTPALVDRYRATLGLAGPAAAMGDAAPRMIHLCLCHNAVAGADLGEDGHPARGSFLPPVPLPRRMWAAGTMRFDGTIPVGASITRRSTIADVTMKQGSSGALCFVEVRHEIRADGAPVVNEVQTIVYRNAEAPDRPATPVPAKAPVLRETAASEELAVPTPLLFRFSALTFNSHRIHYDLPYATAVEGYPGLVVHGPLQASLLFHFAARQHGREPDEFSFRSRASLFAGQPLLLAAGRDAGGTLDLWASAPGGAAAMEAKATWDAG